MGGFLLRGILIGLLFGVPVGAVGVMTVERTWNYGIRAGLLTGLGSSVADSVYSFVGAMGLTVVSGFLLKYEAMIHFLGGSLVLFMGAGLLMGKEKAMGTGMDPDKGKAAFFLSSFAVGIMNPAAVLTFLFAFSWFGVTGDHGLAGGLMVVLGVFLGTYFWWGALSFGVELAKKRGRGRDFRYMNRIFGIVLSLFGIGILWSV